MKIVRKYKCETILLCKYSQEEIVEFVRENCIWFDELSQIQNDPRLWGKPIKAEANTSPDLLTKGNEIRISPSGFVQVMHRDGYVCGEGVLPDVSAGDNYIIIKI